MREVVWIIISVIFIVAFGPLMWLRPSPRERRLARLRQRAYELGLRVELRKLPRPDVAAGERVSAGGRPRDTTAEYAAYLCPLAARLRMLPSWRLLRHGDGIVALPGWAFEAGRRPDHVRLEAALSAAGDVLRELPDDVIAVECQPLGLGAYWLEGPETGPERVDELAVLLRRAGAALTELDARLKAAAEADPADD